MIPEYRAFIREIKKYLVGFEKIARYSFMCLLCDMHVLLEGPPGLAKTRFAKIFSRLLDLKFSRIQGTPDLLPADILGYYVFDQSTGSFKLRKGPIFANFVLFDEINRAPPRTQSALLQAMEERQVTIENTTLDLPYPFMVMATQNPYEQEGTYPLPEAQLDRFAVRLFLEYPSKEAETEIMRKTIDVPMKINPIISLEQLENLKKEMKRVEVGGAPKIIAEIIDKLRKDPRVEWGPSPRGSIALLKLARANSFLAGEGYISLNSIREVAIPVLNHRMGLTPEAKVEGISTKDIIREVLEEI